jgi:SAM-dependent methyltransferase
MPVHEKTALQLCEGRILDVGAGSGVHSLELQKAGKDVTALEKSPYASRAMRLRGVEKVVEKDFFNFRTDRPFDTLLFLMNGAGIMGTMARVEAFFSKIDELLAPGGKVLLHTSDISYVYFAYDLPLPPDRYYGEVMFYLKYKHMCGEPFPWLYFDAETFKDLCRKYGFEAKVTEYDREGDILMEIKRNRYE